MKCIVTLATLVAFSIPASASVVQVQSGFYEGSLGTGGVSATSQDFQQANFASFNWDATPGPYSAFVAFESDTSFDLLLSSYVDNGTGDETFRASGLLFEQTDGLNGEVLAGGFLTTNVEGCGQDLFVIDYPSCDYVSFTGYSGFGSEHAHTPGDVIFSGLEAGFYRISIVESGVPEFGSASFGYQESMPAVPVPAALPLMLTAFGGMAFAARRRKG